MKKIIAITLILIIIVAGVLYWNYTTFGGRLTDAEEASRSCNDACLHMDKIRWCTEDKVVGFSGGGTWENVSCNTLRMNEITGPCPQIPSSSCYGE